MAEKFILIHADTNMPMGVYSSKEAAVASGWIMHNRFVSNNTVSSADPNMFKTPHPGWSIVRCVEGSLAKYWYNDIDFVYQPPEKEADWQLMKKREEELRLMGNYA